MSGERTAIEECSSGSWRPQNSWGAGSIGDRIIEEYTKQHVTHGIPPWMLQPGPPMQYPPPQPKPSAWESEAQLAEMLRTFGVNKEAAAEIAKRHAEMQFDIYRRAFEAGFDAGFTKGKEKDVEG